MTISAAIAQIRDQIRDGFADIKASIASKQTLADGNSELQSQLAAVTGQLAEANAKVAELSASLATVEAERDAKASEVVERDSKIAALEADAATAEQKAASIVANLGAAPVKATTDTAAPGTLAEELAACKTGAERAKVLAKYGGASKAFRTLRSA